MATNETNNTNPIEVAPALEYQPQQQQHVPGPSAGPD